MTATGFVDIATADTLATAIHQATVGQRVLLDLTRVRFVGTAGIAVLFHRRHSFAAVLVAADSSVDRALTVTGFPTIPTAHTRAGT